jgi:membrane protein YdbS with pleckstrin-like domain
MVEDNGVVVGRFRVSRKHSSNLVKYLFCIVLVLIGICLFVQDASFMGFRISQLSVVSWIGIIGIGTLETRRKKVLYEVTNTKIIKTDGFFRKKRNVLLLSQIRNVSISQSIWERLLDVGSLELRTEEIKFVFSNINSPGHLEDIISSSIKGEYKNSLAERISGTLDMNALRVGSV